MGEEILKGSAKSWPPFDKCERKDGQKEVRNTGAGDRPCSALFSYKASKVVKIIQKFNPSSFPDARSMGLEASGRHRRVSKTRSEKRETNGELARPPLKVKRYSEGAKIYGGRVPKVRVGDVWGLR